MKRLEKCPGDGLGKNGGCDRGVIKTLTEWVDKPKGFEDSCTNVKHRKAGQKIDWIFLDLYECSNEKHGK